MALNITQKQIMRSWKKDEPCIVSVICVTFNHEQYIRGAIESFLMQETDFPFEVIIHDDASTDNTPDIIKEYNLSYPDIIKIFLQKENQRFKGGFKPAIFASGFSRGKYIALCEGDDYWVSNQKLQIQIEAMQGHPELDFSLHSAYRSHNGVCDSRPSWNYGYDRVLKSESVLSNVGSFAPSPSYMFRREILTTLPEWYFNTAPVGDVFLEIFGSIRGGALYIDKPMAVYRVKSVGSWSSKYHPSRSSYYDHWNKMLESFSHLKEEYINYPDALNKKIADALCHISSYYLLSRDDEKFMKYIIDSRESFNGVSIKQRILYLGRLFPSMLRALFKIQSLIRAR